MASHHVARATQPRTEPQRQKDLETISEYRNLEDQFRQRVAQQLYDDDTFQLTSKILRQNPEYYTVWNVRRRCLISGRLFKPSDGSSPSTALPNSSANDTPTTSSADLLPSSSTQTQQSQLPQKDGTSGTIADLQAKNQESLRHELDFTIPLLMSFPKCYWIWNYRMWLLQQVIDYLDVSPARKFWEEELGLVSKMLHRDRRNFHAWTYRRHVVANLESPVLAGTSLAESEFEYTSQKIEGDLSNFSAWHNRSKLLPQLLDQRGSNETERKKLLVSELSLVGEGLNLDPEDQSLWYYHQFLILNIVEKQNVSCFVPNLNDEERVELISHEIENIKDLLEDYRQVKWIHEALVEYVMAIVKVENRKLTADEQGEISTWLQELKKLDPQRQGRWIDFASRFLS